MTRRWWLWATVTALVASACMPGPVGPSPTEPPPTTTSTSSTTTTTLAPADAVAAFEACLTDRGVEMGAIPLDPGGRPLLEEAMADLDLSDADTLEALGECSRYLTGGALDLSQDLLFRQDVVSLLTRFSECVRSYGVSEFPDPEPGFAGVGPPFPVDEIPYHDPRLEVAVVNCRAELATP